MDQIKQFIMDNHIQVDKTSTVLKQTKNSDYADK